MGFKFYSSSALLLLSYIVALSSSSNMPESVSVKQYFSDPERVDLNDITWAHAVNNHAALTQAINDPHIMMLEADVLMGVHKGSHNLLDNVPIMAHPPDKESYLSFTQFVDTFIQAIESNADRKKGIKLDFKEIDAVEPCLILLTQKLEDGKVPPFPIIINADILRGPVNSTKKLLDAERFISSVRTHAPYTTISLGWTTRFGHDDEKQGKDVGEPIVKGMYTRAHMKEMTAVIKKYAGDPPIFQHITFPVRAALAASSVDELLCLQGKMRNEFSITLWSPKDDPIDLSEVESTVSQIGKRYVFLDLPFRIESNAKHFHHQEEHEHEHILDDQSVHHNSEQGISARGHSEEEPPKDKDMSAAAAAASAVSFIPVITLGLLTAFILYRHL